MLDTNLLVAEALTHRGYDVAVASLSWAELGYGVRKSRTAVERARRESRVLRLREMFGAGLPFDDAAAAAYETICGLVLANGRDVRGRVVDLMIAATAAANGATVITRNTGDFVGLEGFVDVIGA
ncbi:PIN domain-containing protein [Microbacterium sp.]|uniref:PIN domain-containing protein n=1 Tax=Microbacterium sp. TaxID=51671 RepID=UPI0039E5F419